MRMEVYPLRLHPNMDVYISLQELLHKEGWASCWIITGMGSLSQFSLRFAAQDDVCVRKGSYEICAMSGTLCMEGLHIHMVVSNEQGRSFGGHLREGCVIRTTAEIVLGYSKKFLFSRVYDQQTGYPELSIRALSTGE